MYLGKREIKIKHSLANKSSSSKHNFSINSKFKRNLLRTFEIHKKNHFFFFFLIIKLGRVIENKKPRNGGLFNNIPKLKIQYDPVLRILDKAKKWATKCGNRNKRDTERSTDLEKFLNPTWTPLGHNNNWRLLNKRLDKNISHFLLHVLSDWLMDWNIFSHFFIWMSPSSETGQVLHFEHFRYHRTLDFLCDYLSEFFKTRTKNIRESWSSVNRFFCFCFL